MQTLIKPRYFLFLLLLCLVPAVSHAQIAVGVSIRVGPPALPVYTQPPCPVEGYLWTPGYWGYGAAGYYWGSGECGWRCLAWEFCGHRAIGASLAGCMAGMQGTGDRTWASTAVLTTALDMAGSASWAGIGAVEASFTTAPCSMWAWVFHNTFVDRTVVNTTVVNNHFSFNGEGGAMARPTPAEQAVEHENHFQPTPNQVSHENAMAQDRNQLASTNGGHPGTMAMDSVNGRRFNQQGRIASGVASGQLTAGETKNLGAARRA